MWGSIAARMADVGITRVLAAADAARYLRPRDDLLVRERPDAQPASACEARFEGDDGPFRAWHRTVRVRELDAGRSEVSEEVHFRLVLGVWSVLFTPLVRRAVRGPWAAERDRRPWWSPPDRLGRRAARAVASCATLAVVGGFLGGLLGTTLTYVGSELHAGVREQSTVLAVVRIGAVLTIAGMALADRLGRIRLIRLTFLAAAVAAGVGAVAPGLVVVTGAQLVCRGAIAVGVLLLAVVVAEEVPAGSRAFTLGLVTMAGGLGVGIVIWMVPVADAAPWGWRIVWGLGVLTIPVTLAVLARVPEPRRWLRTEAPKPAAPGATEGSVRARRAVAAGAMVLLINLFVAPVSQLQNEYLRTERHYDGLLLVLFLIGTNTWAGIGVVLGGRVADRRSRHLVAMVGLAGLAAGNAVMFATNGWVMWVGSLVGSTIGAATIPSIGVLGPELFPTRRRATANGWIAAAGVGGGAAGLALAGWLIDRSGYGPAFGWLTLAPLGVALVMWLLPETARFELEELNAPEFDDSRHHLTGG
jgi:MFS family permease